jgi:GNAT superfamily N-acetyltransferase
MLHDWYRTVRLPIGPDEFRRLPRNPGYSYVYSDDSAHVSPQPRTLNALLTLRKAEKPAKSLRTEAVAFRPMTEADWSAYPALFSRAFKRVQPFASLTDAERAEAASECLHQTQSGGDGPLILPACFTAQTNDQIVGGILVTLIPRREPGDPWDGIWLEPPPPDAAARGLARPHLTWVFVAPTHASHGIGSALLAHAVNALLGLEFADMASTISLGNETSTLWHWRNGFELMPYAGSTRFRRDRDE